MMVAYLGDSLMWYTRIRRGLIYACDGADLQKTTAVLRDPRSHRCLGVVYSDRLIVIEENTHAKG